MNLDPLNDFQSQFLPLSYQVGGEARRRYDFIDTSIFRYDLTRCCLRSGDELSEGDIPVLALMIPALWVLPQGGFAGLVLLGAMMAFGATLSMQPIALSVGVLILFPLLMVVFSRRSSLGVLLTAGLIVLTLQVGLMVTQQGGKLDGSAWVTVVQTIAVMAMWWSAAHWTPSNKHSWWPLFLLLPLWIAGLPYAVLMALSLTGMLASMEALAKLQHTIRWSKLLCWTLRLWVLPL